MACRVPIVATRVGGIPYVVKDKEHAVLVDPKNPAQLAEAIKRILSDDRIARKIVLNGLKQVRMFNWDVVTDRVIKLYEGVLGISKAK